MDWVLVVSGDDAFQQRSMAMLPKSAKAVGAVSDASARRLVGSLRPGLVLVDGNDDYGHQFLVSLRLLPTHVRPNAIVIGGGSNNSIGFESVDSLEALFATAAA